MRVLSIAILCLFLGGVAAADSRTEMEAALTAQADLYPAAPAFPAAASPLLPTSKGDLIALDHKRNIARPTVASNAATTQITGAATREIHRHVASVLARTLQAAAEAATSQLRINDARARAQMKRPR